jgi:hypothetical protein
MYLVITKPLTVVDRATIPHAKLHKRQNALSFHHVCEAMASRFMKMFHLPGECNPADIMSKHWVTVMFGPCYTQFFSIRELPLT